MRIGINNSHHITCRKLQLALIGFNHTFTLICGYNKNLFKLNNTIYFSLTICIIHHRSICSIHGPQNWQYRWQYVTLTHCPSCIAFNLHNPITFIPNLKHPKRDSTCNFFLCKHHYYSNQPTYHKNPYKELIQPFLPLQLLLCFSQFCLQLGSFCLGSRSCSFNLSFCFSVALILLRRPGISSLERRHISSSIQFQYPQPPTSSKQTTYLLPGFLSVQEVIIFMTLLQRQVGSRGPRYLRIFSFPSQSFYLLSLFFSFQTSLLLQSRTQGQVVWPFLNHNENPVRKNLTLDLIRTQKYKSKLQSLLSIQTCVYSHEDDVVLLFPHWSWTFLAKFLSLDMSWNNFQGELPHELIHLRRLRVLNFGISAGSIPPKLGHLMHLELLSLSNNSLTGSIPNQIFNISSLQVLDLMNNSFSGNIPSTVGYGLINLEELYVNVNKFDGVIPDSISNASQLSILQLSINKFSGPIPNSLEDLRLLTNLSIGDNPMHGFLPTSVGNLSTSLERLYAYSCEIKGKIPEEIGNLSNLWILSLHGNQLSGSIPLAIKGLQNLQVLYFEDNQLGGSVLEKITLNGKVPSSLGGLERLASLSLAHNKLEGTIPDSLRPIPKSLKTLLYLRYINLSFNYLTGEIPFSGPFKNFTYESFMCNDDLCGAQRFHVPPCSSPRIHSRKKILQILGTVSSIAAIVIAATMVILILRCRRKDETSRNTDLSMGMPKWISNQFSNATCQFGQALCQFVQISSAFTRVIASLGKGSFGSVYKGTLTDGTPLL
ncbi:unnamed protein product [Coffea canephora]|uniref:Disease resistance R13L4/SHOC-2-like LRR domain-containing protein n=1 Tax=Coffea canephora TaxID=49390 RepID=A0A068VCL7_COFCA|nr:unnamed protein product [Coffea canephora]